MSRTISTAVNFNLIPDGPFAITNGGPYRVWLRRKRKLLAVLAPGASMNGISDLAGIYAKSKRGQSQIIISSL